MDEGPVYTPETYRDPPRRRNVWPWVLVVVLIMALAGGARTRFSPAWSSGEKNQVNAPSVLGLTSQAAMAKAKALGISIDSKGTMPSADYAAGQVARQVPDEGAKLEKGDAIQVWCPRGKAR